VPLANWKLYSGIPYSNDRLEDSLRGEDRMNNNFSNDKYDYISEYHEGLAFVRERSNGKVGYIDENGEVAIPVEYEYMKDNRYFVYDYFSEGLAALYKDGKLGFVNRNGDVIIDFQYDYGYAFSNGLVGVMKNGKYGFINKYGDVIVPFE
jgi:hypothetical protein